MLRCKTWMLSFALGALVGCDKGASSNNVRTGIQEPSNAPTASAPPIAPPTRVADFDVAALQKQLRCGGSQHREACRILDEFGRAQRWEPRIPSGEGRWVGTAHNVDKGKDKAETLLLSARQVPLNSIAPGDLTIRAGFGSLPDDKRIDGTRLAGALARGDTGPRGNAALAFARTWTSNRECSVVPTAGDSVRLVTEHETYVRQGMGMKVLVVQPHGPSAVSGGDGMYAELWAVAW